MLMRLFFLFLLLYSFATHAQNVDPKQKIIAQYDSVLRNVPREKMYVHLDKTTYLPTDTIWFKAYLIDASVNIPSTISQLIYVDITNETGNVVQRLSLPTALGLTWGSFAMTEEKFKPGNYVLRAYTNWMQNFGDTYFFKKEFKILPILDAPTTIKNNSALAGKAKTSPGNSSTKEKILDIDAQFLPEGGELVANSNQKLAFKVLNSNGKGITVTGEVLDSKENVVAQFAANDKGMGYFNFLPQTAETYSAKINYNGLIKLVKLPKVKAEGSSLAVENNYLADSISFTAFNTNELQEFTMIGQSRGILCFIANIKFNNSKSKTLKLSKSIFPTGVCQVILMDNKMMVTNERNFFVNHHDGLKININASNTSYGLRDNIPIEINVNDIHNKPIGGSFSVAITDDNQVAKDSISDESIVSYFLMNSDLKGEIEKPGYYFHQPNKQKHDDLEALILTQGWVNYNWDLNKKPLFKSEKEYVFSGTVTNVLNKPIPKAKIMLVGNNKGFMMMDTISNEKGEFVFNRLPMMDSASFVIQALNEKGKKGTIGITLNEFKPPLPNLPIQKKLTTSLELDSIAENLVKTKVEAYKLTNRDGLLLNQVTIIGKRGVKDSKNLNGAGGSDYLISEEELNQISKKTLYDVLVEKVKGFREGYPRKSTTRIFFIGFNVLKLVIDGIELDFFYNADEAATQDDYYRYIKSYLDYYNAEDIKGIEVMENRRFSAAYKSRFMHPMDETEYSFLEITTKTGQGPFLKKSANMYLLKPIDYGDLKMFYSPKYTSANKSTKNPDFRSTLYWNPNVLTNEKGEGNFSFYAADKPGSYTVWIEGTDLQGNFGVKTLKLLIK
jgi:hypothetical protein